MSRIIALYAAAAGVIVLVWQWLGSTVAMPVSPLSRGEKIPCISYAPFRANQNPFGPDVPVEPAKIEEDLAQLKPITDCVRTYSVDHGLDQIAPIARRFGMKVLQGLWLSSFQELNRRQIETTLDLAKRFPDTIEAIVIGNEVLLRGEMSAPDLATTIRQVKARVPVPVTYADVWEFWLRHREISPEVDFVTVHILPYWEDVPVPSGEAAAHVDAIYRKVALAFPGKEILIGEFGWPSAGRMREGAQPAPIDQARTLHEVLAAANRESYRVNLIEAYDQPWKRELEGTVGGHWGLFDAYRRLPKFEWRGSVSNHPQWVWQAAAGLALAAVTFLVAFALLRHSGPIRYFHGPAQPAQRVADIRSESSSEPVGLWVRLAVITGSSGSFIGLTLANLGLENLSLADWARSSAWLMVALLSPVLTAAALASSTRLPGLAQVLSRNCDGRLDLVIGFVLVVLAVLSVQAALGLVFDPRYRDFPFAPLLGAAAPLVVLGRGDLCRRPPLAELVLSIVLITAAAYIVWHEGPANWQACLFAAGLLLVALILFRAHDGQSSV